MSDVSEHSEFCYPKKKEKRGGHMIKCLLTELGRAGRENIWPSVMAHGPRCARSVRHDLGSNIFPSGPPTQSVSTYYIFSWSRLSGVRIPWTGLKTMRTLSSPVFIVEFGAQGRRGSIHFLFHGLARITSSFLPFFLFPESLITLPILGVKAPFSFPHGLPPPFGR